MAIRILWGGVGAPPCRWSYTTRAGIYIQKFDFLVFFTKTIHPISLRFGMLGERLYGEWFVSRVNLSFMISFVSSDAFFGQFWGKNRFFGLFEKTIPKILFKFSVSLAFHITIVSSAGSQKFLCRRFRDILIFLILSLQNFDEKYLLSYFSRKLLALHVWFSRLPRIYK